MRQSAWHLRWMRARSNSASNQSHVTVGSKDFTESELLAESWRRCWKAKTSQSIAKFESGGEPFSQLARCGQDRSLSGIFGTSFTEILHTRRLADPRAVYDQIKREYFAGFNVEVSPPLGFENTFAILVRGEEARRLKLKTISDSAKYAPQWRAGLVMTSFRAPTVIPDSRAHMVCVLPRRHANGFGPDLHCAGFK